MRTHSVEGGGGVKLHVRDFGPVDAPPILLIHGWSQHHLCWSKQFESPLAGDLRLVVMDLRGHGRSDVPAGAENYTIGRLWAEDISAIIAALDLNSPVLVGWSYGGLVIGDYLRIYGDEAISAVNLVCAAVGIGPRWFGALIGADFVEFAPLAASDDQAVALKAIQGLLRRMIVRPVSAGDRELAIGWSMLTSAAVRGHLIGRDEDFLGEYERLSKPLLVTMAERTASSCPPWPA